MANTWSWWRRMISAKSSAAPFLTRSSSSASSFTVPSAPTRPAGLFCEACPKGLDRPIQKVIHLLLKLVDFVELVSGQYRADFGIKLRAFNRQIGLHRRHFGRGRADFRLRRTALLNHRAQIHMRIMQR